MAAIAVKSAFTAVGFPLGDAFKAIGRQRVLVIFNTIELPLLIVGIVVLAPHGIVVVAWIVAAVELLHLILEAAVAARLLGISPVAVLRAAGPALAACAGVLAGAGAVRLGWRDAALAPLVAGIAAGLAGGGLALAVLAPAQARRLVGHARELIPGRRPPGPVEA